MAAVVACGVGGFRHPRHHRRELRSTLCGRHRATWLLLAVFARQLLRTGGSVIALTLDQAVGNLPYGVTKGGLDRLVLAAAHELADAGVRANVINPGPIDTGRMTDEIRSRAVVQQPTGRLGTPNDTANRSDSCYPSTANGSTVR